MRYKTKRNGVIYLLGGLMIFVLAIWFLVQDSAYIFRGEIKDLNEIIANGEDIPESGYVTYKISMPLEAYGSERFTSEIKKTYSYAVLDESGMILTVKVKDEDLKKQLDSFSRDGKDTITVTGDIGSNNTDMEHFLKERYSDYAKENGLKLTNYRIDTTQTRGSRLVGIIFALIIGVSGVIIGFSTIKKAGR
ncbi:hypothetical protein [Ruminococcus albus]|uniref:Uncharacterized protein n=1 Tax=Ruminococcus albus TaxID=1264 RepID=A0A1H7G9G3_RUMAL|nr:hypothetical protein [Ruminococcus albus]SEK34768.1 hypothetical protein SAMN05216469_10218 [Ruminococcus albus]